MLRLKLLEQRGKVENSYELELLVRYMSISDFLLLYNIGKNVSAILFKDILKGLQGSQSQPSAPLIESPKGNNKLYDTSFVNDLANAEDTIDLKLRKKIAEEDESNV